MANVLRRIRLKGGGFSSPTVPPVVSASSLRLVADHASPNDTFFPTIPSIMSRSSHNAQVTITDIGLVIGNYHARDHNYGVGAPDADTGTGGSATVTASIEYPADTFTQIKFSGIATGTVPDRDLLVSDIATLAIPNGAQFWTRIYLTNPNGICTTTDPAYAAQGDLSKHTTGVTDQTMSGTIAANTTIIVRPIAIIGTSTGPAVAIVGTSVAAGYGDDQESETGRHGFGQSFTTVPHVNLCQGGSTCQAWIDNHPIHQKLLQYCTAMVTDQAANDYPFLTPTPCIVEMQKIYALFPSKQIFQTTMIPRVNSSSDGYMTVEGQSLTGITYPPEYEVNRKGLNAEIRLGIANVTGYFDVTSILESSFESSKFRAATDPYGNSAPFVLNDGNHPTASAYLALRDSGLFDQSVFTGGTGQVTGDVLLLEGDQAGNLLLEGDESGGFILDVGFGAAATGFLSRTTGLDSIHRNAYGALIDGLVDDGVWGDIDLLYIFATQDSATALLNIRGTLYNATAVGSPTFTANQGFMGGTGKYINTNWNPATQIVPHYRLTNAHWMIRSNTNVAENTMVLGNNLSSNHWFLRLASDQGYTRFHNGGGTPETVTTSQGTFMVDKTATGNRWYRNGAPMSGAEVAQAAGAAIDSGNMFILACGPTTPSSESNRQIAAVSFGGRLGSTLAAAYNTRLAAFLTAVGAP
jgi:hypothetical protein